jgi:hypothetical protein
MKANAYKDIYIDNNLNSVPPPLFWTLDAKGTFLPTCHVDF